MTHLHIPDGILPIRIWMLGIILMALAIGFSVHRLRSLNLMKKIPLLGAVSAVMLVAMSLEILPLAYHINLSVVAGIMLGPSLGFLAAFIANLILAFMGHGGITVIGLNTLLLGSEAVLGHTLYSLFSRWPSVFWRAAMATLLTLMATTMALVGIVALSGIDPEFHHHADGHAPVAEGRDSISTFASLVLSLGSIGWIIEAAITGAVVKFISQVKPGLLDHVRRRAEDI